MNQTRKVSQNDPARENAFRKTVTVVIYLRSKQFHIYRKWNFQLRIDLVETIPQDYDK